MLSQSIRMLYVVYHIITTSSSFNNNKKRHEGPIHCLEFSQIENVLFSGSWDKSVRIHDIFSRKTNVDVLDHNSEITALCVRNDGKQACVATLKGEIYIWDVKNAQVVGNIDCKRDVRGEN